MFFVHDFECENPLHCLRLIIDSHADFCAHNQIKSWTEKFTLFASEKKIITIRVHREIIRIAQVQRSLKSADLNLRKSLAGVVIRQNFSCWDYEIIWHERERRELRPLSHTFGFISIQFESDDRWHFECMLIRARCLAELNSTRRKTFRTHF